MSVYANMYEWLESAEGGCKGAQYNIAIAFKVGFPGWPKSKKKAFRWFHMAATSGSIEAMHELVNCYSRGLGVEKNPELVELWNQRIKMNCETDE